MSKHLTGFGNFENEVALIKKNNLISKYVDHIKHIQKDNNYGGNINLHNRLCIITEYFIEKYQQKTNYKIKEQDTQRYITNIKTEMRRGKAQKHAALFLAWAVAYHLDEIYKFYEIHNLAWPSEFKKFRDEFVVEHLEEYESQNENVTSQDQNTLVTNENNFDNNIREQVLKLSTEKDTDIWQPKLSFPHSIQINDKGDNWLSPIVSESIPFVGREKEIQELNNFAKNTDPFKVWAISGPSGAGKTRLVIEWMRAFKKEQEEDKNGFNNWHIGFLKDSVKSEWKDWEPNSPTIIVIDYIYKFSEDIKTIFETCLELNAVSPNVRLLLIDHVFPSNLDNLWKEPWFSGVSTGGTDWDEKKKVFYQDTSLKLEKENQSQEDLMKIMRSSAKHHGCELDDATLNNAIEELDNFTGAWCPLFAALRGRALAQNSSLVFSNRRDLIYYYLETSNRLPWLSENESKREIGEWVGCFVVISTLFRGMPLDILMDSLPENFREGRVVKQQCFWIVSNISPIELPPFEPDILGESFFLLFLDYLHTDAPRHLKPKFIEMLCLVEKTTKWHEKIEEFLGSLERVVRNLKNDDQSDDNIKRLWQQLCNFFNPKSFLDYPKIRQTVSIILANIGFELKKYNEDLSSQSFSNISSYDLFYASIGPFVSEAAIAFMTYYDSYYEHLNQPNEMTEQLLVGTLINLENYYISINYDFNSLLTATHYGKTRVVSLIIRERINVINSGVISNGWTSLMIACYNGYYDVAKLLLKHKANINLGTINTGQTALITASFRGHYDIVSLLLEYKANVNQSTIDNGRTPLMAASEFGHHDIVKLLLEHKASVNQATLDKSATALLFASQNGHYRVVNILLKYEANVNQSLINGDTPLIASSAKGHHEVVKLLLKHKANVNQASVDDGKTALIIASHNGYYDIARLLLEQKANVNQSMIDNGYTALIAACIQGHCDIVSLLLEHKANINQSTINNGSTALILAIKNEHKMIVPLLLNSKVDVDVNKAEYLFGTTALMYACCNGDKKLVSLLMEADANINLADKEGWTPLMWASYNNNTNLLKHLISKGADVNKINSEGHTALIIAKNNNYHEAVEVLSTQG